MEGENGERTRLRALGIGRFTISQSKNYWVEGKILGAIPISRPIHGRCLMKLLSLNNILMDVEVDKLLSATPIEERRRDLRCYFCRRYLDLELKDI